MHRRQHRITFGKALAVLAGLAALAFGGEWGPGVMFARWSPQDEISSLRTEDSKTFDNHDGTRSVVIAGALRPPVPPLDSDSTVHVGDERYDQSCVWYVGAHYFRCQHLYLDWEMGFSGVITRLAFYSDSAGTDTLNQSYQWLNDVADTILATPDSWIAEGSEVWQGDTVLSDTGWKDLPLQAPFLHARGSNLLVSYRYLGGSSESLCKCYRTSYAGGSVIRIRAQWGANNNNPQPYMFQSAWRANILITYVPLSEAFDVQTEAIVSPADSVIWQQPCVPKAVVRNNGISPAGFAVQFRISDGYANSVNVYALQPGAEDTVSFPAWTPARGGLFRAQCSTCLARDSCHANDRETASVFVVCRDVGVSRILVPTGIVHPGDSVLPEALVWDYGTTDENPWVVMEILGNGAGVYVESARVSVASGDSALVPLARYWHANSLGEYAVTAWTSLTADMNHGNDTAYDSVTVRLPPRRDVGVVAIAAPAGTVDSGATVTPCARLSNLGDLPETRAVRFTISDSPPYVGDTVFVNLAPHVEQDVRFPSWTARHCGIYTARCSLLSAPDDNPVNDTLSVQFEVEAPSPWCRMADVPGGAQHKAVRGGAAVASDGANLVYALKGSGTREFYAYRATGDSWSRCCSIPRTRKSARSAALCYSPGIDRVYAASANSSELWQYRPEDNTWRRRADVPVGNNGRRPGNGVCLAAMDTGSIYLLKGNGTSEFSAFDHVRDTWLSLSPVPAGVSGRGCRAGSCLIAVRDYLYLLKGGGNEFFAYSTLDDTWHNRTPLPMTGAGAGRKAARAGTAIAHDHDIIYVLKGGKCGDLWWYDTFGDSWVEQRSLPLGPGLRPVADGGALAFAAGRLWALKGNNTREFWAYQPQNADRTPLSAVRSKEIQGQSAVCTPQLAVRVNPNPFSQGATISCSLPVSGELGLRLYDINGRLVRTLCSGQRPAGTFSAEITEPLPLGVYLLRLSTSTQSITRQLVRQ
jgi:hypothetical protein